MCAVLLIKKAVQFPIMLLVEYGEKKEEEEEERTEGVFD